MPSFVWINGRLVPESKARISVDDSAYLYGHGLFETLRAEKGKILFLEEHLRRLKKNSDRLGLRLPLSLGRIKRDLTRTLKKNRLREAHLRINLSQSALGSPHLVMTAKPYVPYPESYYKRGAPLILVCSVRNDAGTIAAILSPPIIILIVMERYGLLFPRG